MRKLLPFVLGTLAFIVAISTLALLLYFQPAVEITIDRELTQREGNKLARMLRDGASLADIRNEIYRRGGQLSPAMLADAVHANRIDALRYMLEQGANPNGDMLGTSPLAIAISMQRVEMISLLLGHGADPDHPLGNGMTPRSIAELEGNPEVLAVLPPSPNSAQSEEVDDDAGRSTVEQE